MQVERVGIRSLELCVAESCQQRLKVKCSKVLLDRACIMEWKLWR